MMILSLLFLAWTSLVFAGGSAILEQSLKLAGSPMVTGDFDEAALGFLLKWSGACLQTYLFLLLGTIALASLFITRKGYFHDQTRREK